MRNKEKYLWMKVFSSFINMSDVSLKIPFFLLWLLGLLSCISPPTALSCYYEKMHMGGLAFMVISLTNWEFLPFFMSKFWIILPCIKSFIDFIWTFRKRQVIICQTMINKSLHLLSNQIQAFLNFCLTMFKIWERGLSISYHMT